MAVSIDHLEADPSFTQNVKGQVTFLPEPERANRWTPVISVDDHIVEPPGAFAEEAARICWSNASDLFRHPVPDSVVNDPDGF